jgi:hypothetical protein
MVIFLYRWRIKIGSETQFVSSWTEITEDLKENYSSLGSRLHFGDDGLFYGYAQWNSLEDRETAFQNRLETNANKLMAEAIDESFPVVILNPLKDFLDFPIFK